VETSLEHSNFRHVEELKEVLGLIEC
jgi:hypothetical protein